MESQDVVSENGTSRVENGFHQLNVKGKKTIYTQLLKLNSILK